MILLILTLPAEPGRDWVTGLVIETVTEVDLSFKNRTYAALCNLQPQGPQLAQAQPRRRMSKVASLSNQEARQRQCWRRVLFRTWCFRLVDLFVKLPAIPDKAEVFKWRTNNIWGVFSWNLRNHFLYILNTQLSRIFWPLCLWFHVTLRELCKFRRRMLAKFRSQSDAARLCECLICLLSKQLAS